MRANQLPSLPGVSSGHQLNVQAVRAINQSQVYFARSGQESAAQAKLHAFFVAAAAACAPGAFTRAAPVAPEGKQAAADKPLTPAQKRAAEAAAAGAQ